ncbi:hypothetical protein I4F81_007363 [Pyropia yezoensis]|uniref:Uncharacterized protein n=1 Tax=Pyropia yezoensis TaxID=2788 RepID=A0ACC3C4C6_PYRYE|nr:hypothetical protein I4F81_007363 [Neopyropia yezoensis]
MMSVKKAPHAGFSEAIAAAANVLAGATDLPCSRSIPFPGDKAAFTTVATTTAMVVAQAVPQAVKLLAGVLVDDALKAGPPPAGDLPGDAAERKWLQAKAASKVAAALLAGAVKVRDAQWPQEFPVPVRALVHGAMSSVFERYKMGSKRPGGAAPSIESQEAAMALNLSDASVLVCKMGLDLCNNAVATAVSDRPHLLDFLFAACIDARRRAKAVLVACCPALRAAMALTPLAAAAVGDDVQQKAEV